MKSIEKKTIDVGKTLVAIAILALSYFAINVVLIGLSFVLFRDSQNWHIINNIILFGSVAVFIISIVILVNVHRKKYVRIFVSIHNEKYELAINQGLRFKRSPFALSPIQRDMTDINIAYSYLALNDVQNFYKYINLVSMQSMFPLKYFWIAFVKLYQKDLEGARGAFAEFQSCQETTPPKGIRPKGEYQEILEAAFIYEEGNLQVAKEKIEQAYPKVNSPIMLKYFVSALQDIEKRLVVSM